MPMSTCPRCGNTMRVYADSKKQMYTCPACGLTQKLGVKNKGATKTTVSYRGG